MRLDHYDNSWYFPGSRSKRALWYLTNVLFFQTPIPWPSSLKKVLLHLFGAKIGKGVVIKPSVNIKYPWFLEIGNHVWIGEGCWLDSLDKIVIGDHTVLSQGSYLLTGSHDYKKESFDLILAPIHLEEGVWIGAKAVVCPGIRCRRHSILTVASVATKDLEENGIYQGNPAKLKRMRKIA